MTRHVTELLNDYVDGLLTSEQRVAVDQHLAQCPDCRAELQALSSLLRRSSQLPRNIRPQRDLWPGIENRLRAGGKPPVFPFFPFRQFPQGSRLAWAAAAMIGIAVLGYWWYGLLTTPSWNIAILEGVATVGSGVVSGESRIRVGDVLETGSDGRARIQVGVIGHVEVAPNTRVTLLQASLTDHRLGLDEGKIHATIIAPPRLFFVETPSALAVDLGCVYTLEVDSSGSGLLRVTSGWVALQFNGRESIVPAGAMCRTRPGFGPGTPYQEDASERMINALYRYDFETDPNALSVVLVETRNMDSITLWHLFLRTQADDRAAVYDRLSALVPPPAGVTREGVLRGEGPMIAAWQRHLNLGYMEWWSPVRHNN